MRFFCVAAQRLSRRAGTTILISSVGEVVSSISMASQNWDAWNVSDEGAAGWADGANGAAGGGLRTPPPFMLGRVNIRPPPCIKAERRAAIESRRTARQLFRGVRKLEFDE